MMLNALDGDGGCSHRVRLGRRVSRSAQTAVTNGGECDDHSKAKKDKVTRRHKMLIHGGLLLGIIVSLWFDGGKPADWLFVGLSIATEVA